MMTLEEIYEALKAKFGDKIQELRTPPQGDHYILIEPQAMNEVCHFLKAEKTLFCNILHCLSSLDLPKEKKLAVVYHIYSSKHSHRVTLRAEMPRDDAHVASVTDVWPAADWHEREAYDMMGMIFDNHPDPRRILCPEDWEGYPLRKDYQVQEKWHGMHVPYVEHAGEKDGHWVFPQEGN